VKFKLKFRGYFDLYNIPFKHISLFDFTERKSPLCPDGMNRGTNISDFLETKGIAHHISDPNRSETENFDAMLADVQTGRIDFGFVYAAELDGLLHRAGNLSPEISPKLRAYEARIRQLLDAAHGQYEEVRLYIFSDHGMANCDTLLDLQARIGPLVCQPDPGGSGQSSAAVYGVQSQPNRASQHCISPIHDLPGPVNGFKNVDENIPVYPNNGSRRNSSSRFSWGGEYTLTAFNAR
jgi:hypothetical protein